ncbi:predicted protein [Histoplasma mississippiense (nom. inval.)]|uniref:predicted protein n=1 Tax=Ajellomyces capsulatus (strain NAm1 / WU24) TaxID=2059318 RepID=UPI000157D4C2|nr:predicted protein [Histoplasma mississippiense (nom. inval.)]EDN05244.1 predicted protein [Histoplasma mississippiense (nom. inval.)]
MAHVLYAIHRLIACLYLFERVCSRCDKIIAAQHDPLTFYYGDDDESTGIPTLFEQYASSLEKFLPVLQDEHGRLRVWTGNIGAHKSRRSSLDYRLRDASQVRGQVASLLDVLEVSLSEVLAIVSGERPVEEEDTEEWSDDDYLDDESIPSEEGLPQPAELFQLLEDIQVVIKCLYKLSMVIRHPAQHDRIKTNVDLSHFTQFDIQHVEQKFPNAERWLVQRLGKAITKRREYLKGRELHHEKLNHGADATAAALFEDDSHTEAAQRTLLSETTATTFDYGLVAALHTAAGETDADPAPSETSYASTVGDDTKLHFPPIPEEAEHNPDGFECPYCYYLVSIRGPLSWARHIFDDLQPYICTFRDCPTPHQTYSRRRTWFNHEKTAHRAAGFPHSDSRFVPLQSSGPVDSLSAVDCPLCGVRIPNLHHLERHLARHLEQLALFALPHDFRDDDDQRDSPESGDDNPSSDSLEDGSEGEMEEYHAAMPRPEETDVDVDSPLSSLLEEYKEPTPESNIESYSSTMGQDPQTPMSALTDTYKEVNHGPDALPDQSSHATQDATSAGKSTKVTTKVSPEEESIQNRLSSIQRRIDELSRNQEERKKYFNPNPRHDKTSKAFSPKDPPSV